MSEVRDLERRVTAIEIAIASAATGDFDVGLEIRDEDELSSVEAGINVMLDSLKSLFEENRRKTAELERSLSTITAQRDAIRALSTPVIEVWDDVVVLPVIGHVDPARCMDILGSLLQAISGTRARRAILDLTGVESVAKEAAEGLIQVVRGARFLGAQCVVTGLSPKVARAMVDLGVSLADLDVRSDLKAGLRESIRLLERRPAGAR